MVLWLQKSTCAASIHCISIAEQDPISCGATPLSRLLHRLFQHLAVLRWRGMDWIGRMAMVDQGTLYDQ